MNQLELTATIFSVLAMSALVLSITIKNRKKSLFVQMVSCALESIAYFVSGGLTGAALSAVNAIRTLFFINREKINKVTYNFILVLFLAVIIFGCFATWSGPISLLPTVGSIFRTYALWQTNMMVVRISGMTTALTYGIYCWHYDLKVLLIGDIILLFVSLISIYKYDIMKRPKTRNK